MTSPTIKDTVAQQFDPVADNYRTSSVHAAGEDLPPVPQTQTGAEAPVRCGRLPLT